MTDKGIAAAPAASGDLPGQVGWHRAAEPLVAAMLVLGASFANFLSYHGYPALRLEVLYIALGLLAVSAVFAALHALGGNLGKAILDGFLVFLAVDLNSDQYLLAAGAAALVAFLRLGRGISLLKPLAIVAAVVLASSATGLSKPRAAIDKRVAQGAPTSQSKAILHIILDEHGGVGGSRDAALQQQLRAFYAARGFRLFERAYSRHFHTVNAIPDVLNFGHPGDSRNVSETLDIGRTSYLSGLEQAGYRLHFYQSDFADYCRYSRFASCTAYWSPSLDFVAPLAIPAGEKARLMLLKFTALSNLLQAITGGVDTLTHLPLTRPLGIPVMAIKERAASSSLGGLAALDRMAVDAATARPGDVLFAHILAPHFPYVTRPDCSVVAPSRWQYRRSSRPVAEREAAYKAQVQCVLAKLDKIAAAFRASPGGKSGVIILHGDHGSRITGLDPIEPNAGKLTPADLMAGYSTLFAVSGPTIAAGEERRPFATPDLLKALAASDFASMETARPGDGRVHLDGPNWTVGKPASIAKAWPRIAD